MLPNYIICKPLEIRLLAYTGMGSTYANVGTPLEEPAIMMQYYNSTNQDLYVSWFDLEDHMIIKAGEVRIMDIANNQGTGGTLLCPQNTQIKVRAVGSIPTSGSLYISAFTAAAPQF
jgi:hypothetical protein